MDARSQLDRAHDFFRELSERIEGWGDPVGWALNNPPPLDERGCPTITLSAYGIPEQDTRSELSVGAGPEEITVGFSTYHTHFNYAPGGAYGREHAFEFISALQRETYGVATHFRRGKPLRCWVLNPYEGGGIPEYPALYFGKPGRILLKLPWAKDYIHVFTWRGAVNTYYDMGKASRKLELPAMDGELVDWHKSRNS